MGGEVMVGIRNRNGKEWLSLRHTNPMPWILRQPKFYSDEVFLQEIIDRAQPGNVWPKSVPCERVEPSEYGVILVDFVTRQILSRQVYCAVGSLVFRAGGGRPTDAETLEILCPPGWTIDHATVRALYDWPEVQSWLSKNGWGSPSDLSKEDQARWAAYVGEDEGE